MQRLKNLYREEYLLHRWPKTKMKQSPAVELFERVKPIPGLISIIDSCDKLNKLKQQLWGDFVKYSCDSQIFKVEEGGGLAFGVQHGFGQIQYFINEYWKDQNYYKSNFLVGLFKNRRL